MTRERSTFLVHWNAPERLERCRRKRTATAAFPLSRTGNAVPSLSLGEMEAERKSRNALFPTAAELKEGKGVAMTSPVPGGTRAMVLVTAVCVECGTGRARHAELVRPQAAREARARDGGPGRPPDRGAVTWPPTAPRRPCSWANPHPLNARARRRCSPWFEEVLALVRGGARPGSPMRAQLGCPVVCSRRPRRRALRPTCRG
jgi:hypothetical protein